MVTWSPSARAGAQGDFLGGLAPARAEVRILGGSTAPRASADHHRWATIRNASLPEPSIASDGITAIAILVRASNQYRAGTVSYLDVVAQATALDNERAAVDLRGSRMVAAVLLIKALGGGWTGSASDGARSHEKTLAPGTRLLLE
jgi:hypothetical protein